MVFLFASKETVAQLCSFNHFGCFVWPYQKARDYVSFGV